MPLDVLGRTRATMINSTSFFFLVRKDVGNLLNIYRDVSFCFVIQIKEN